MANYDTVKFSGVNEQRGWCQLFPEFLKSDVEIINSARNGRSSKSFYYEVWTKLRNQLNPGDYVFIQFGHNDEKNNGLDTDENDTTARGTAPYGQYSFFLQKYAKEARDRGAIPILFTPVVRRYFENQHLTPKAMHNLSINSEKDSSLNYVSAMKKVAVDLSVPLVDLTSSTQQLVETLGPEKSKEIVYVVNDDTHLKQEGARRFAYQAVISLKALGLLKSELK